MKHIKCLFGRHDFRLENEVDEKTQPKEGWIGDQGYNLIKTYKCQRKDCNGGMKEFLKWSSMCFCIQCNEETRHRNRVWSDSTFRWDSWEGQGDGHFFSKCLKCNEIDPSLESEMRYCSFRGYGGGSGNVVYTTNFVYDWPNDDKTIEYFKF